MGTGREKGMRESDHALTPHPFTQCRLAGRECDQVGVYPAGPDSAKVERAVGQDQGGPVGPAVVHHRMGREVEVSVPGWPVVEPIGRGCLTAKQQIGPSGTKKVGDSPRFL